MFKWSLLWFFCMYEQLVSWKRFLQCTLFTLFIHPWVQVAEGTVFWKHTAVHVIEILWFQTKVRNNCTVIYFEYNFLRCLYLLRRGNFAPPPSHDLFTYVVLMLTLGFMNDNKVRIITEDNKSSIRVAAKKLYFSSEQTTYGGSTIRIKHIWKKF